MNKNVKIKVEKALTEPVLEYIRKFSGLSLAERFTALGKDLLEYSKACLLYTSPSPRDS